MSSEEKGLIKLNSLKDIDKKILRHLIEDSHQSLNAIAESDEIKTTGQNVSQRIKKLQERNIIKNYTITLQNEKIEELRVKAYILFREDPNPELRKENAKLLESIPQVTTFARVFGKYDGIIEIIVRDNDEVTQIVNKLHLLKGLKETETFIVHTVLKDDQKAPILNLLK